MVLVVSEMKVGKHASVDISSVTNCGVIIVQDLQDLRAGNTLHTDVKIVSISNLISTQCFTNGADHIYAVEIPQHIIPKRLTLLLLIQ